MLEHRCSERRVLTLNVVLNHRGIGLVRGRTCDICMGGMFVETGRIRLSLNALVEATLLFPEQGATHIHRAEAMVVHHKGSGAGLMFHDIDDGLHERLYDLLYRHPQPLGGLDDRPQMTAP